MRIANGLATSPLPFDAEYIRDVQEGPDDGNLVATTTTDDSLWIYDLRRQTRSKLPDGEVRHRAAPAWSPDSSRIALFVAPMAGWPLYVQRVDGVSLPEMIFRLPDEKGAGAFTPDGLFYVFTHLRNYGRFPAVPHPACRQSAGRASDEIHGRGIEAGVLARRQVAGVRRE